MSPMIFGTALAFGSFAIALWADVRFPQLAPGEMGRILLHTLAAFFALRVVAGLVGPLAASATFGVAAAFAVGLASLVYAFLVGVWALRMFAGAYAGMR